MKPIKLYTKPNCHLCEDGLWMLKVAMRDHAFTFEAINIEQDVDLMARYGDRIPVLSHPTCSTELGWPFMPDSILAWLDTGNLQTG